MAEKFIYKLKIDDDFKQLIPPLSAEEHQQLEQNIIRDGCRDPLCIWNNTILDGHNRYEICTRQCIPFTVRRIYFKHREAAIAWICATQLGRRNISEETRKYLIGKRYEMEKILGAHNAVGTNQHTQKEVRATMLPRPPINETVIRTRERLGEEYNISHTTVLRYGKYSYALDTLSKVVPELVPKILSGEVKISHENIVDMSRLSGQNIRWLCQHLSADDTEFVGYLRKALPKKQNFVVKPHIPKTTGSVKNMPAYDPDAEIFSLALTVPSWVMSIDRARSVTNLSDISDNARLKLEKVLLGLKKTINSMLTAIKEEI